MRVLLDECLPRRLKYEIAGHTVYTVHEMNWTGVKNGTLLRQAAASFDVFITGDKNIKHQQIIANLPLAIVVLIAHNNRLASLSPLVPKLLLELPDIKPGQLVEISPDQ